MHISLQVSDKIVQTETSFVEYDGPVVNLTFNEDTNLSICHSFIIENTLACDDTPVYVESDAQTIESGGLVSSLAIQTDLFFETEFNVFTENHLSESDVHQNEDVLSHFRAKTNTWCQTLKVKNRK